jgi:hypothetical protein
MAINVDLLVFGHLVVALLKLRHGDQDAALQVAVGVLIALSARTHNKDSISI